MPLEKVKLSNVKIVEQNGQYGPSFNIRFTQHLDMGERPVSGFVKPIQFIKDNWKEGATIELEIFQKGNYWNFKLPSSGGVKKPEALGSKELLDAILRIEGLLKQIVKAKDSNKNIHVFEDDVPFPEEVPF